MTAEERDALRTIRRRRLRLWGLIVAGAPIIWVAYRTTGSFAAALSTGIAWLIALLISAGLVLNIRCPRCGGYFHAKGRSPLFAHPLAQGCMRCKLPLHADRVIYPSME